MTSKPSSIHFGAIPSFRSGMSHWKSIGVLNEKNNLLRLTASVRYFSSENIFRSFAKKKMFYGFNLPMSLEKT